MDKAKKQQMLRVRVIDDAWLERLDRWRNSQPVPPDRSAVIRLAVERFLEAEEAKEKKKKQ